MPAPNRAVSELIPPVHVPIPGGSEGRRHFLCFAVQASGKRTGTALLGGDDPV